MKTATPGPKILFRLLLLGISFGLTYAASCYSHKDCKTCTRSSSWSKNCRWCPLERTCHAYGSWYNSCTSKQTVYAPGKCFDTDKGKYEPKEAYTNTLLSAAAYGNSPDKCARRYSRTADYKITQLVGHACHDISLFKGPKCFAYTAVSKQRKKIVVSFRGTVNTRQLLNQFTSILFVPKVRSMIGGHVQRFFARAFEKLNPCVEETVRKLVKQYPGFKVTVTGHSLGGALASLTAVSLVHKNIVARDNLTLYTFGQPRVGDKDFAYHHDKLLKGSWRVVHYLDIVTNIPTCTPVIGCTLEGGTGPYHHGVEIFYPKEEMKESSKYIECKDDESSKCSNGHISSCANPFKMKQCYNDHLYYFGVNVGSACLLPSSKLRFLSHGQETMDDDAELERRLFANNVCNVIDLSGES